MRLASYCINYTFVLEPVAIRLPPPICLIIRHQHRPLPHRHCHYRVLNARLPDLYLSHFTFHHLLCWDRPKREIPLKVDQTDIFSIGEEVNITRQNKWF
jgi:hypothetical protein